jgi:hypothetical protein
MIGPYLAAEMVPFPAMADRHPSSPVRAAKCLRVGFVCLRMALHNRLAAKWKWDFPGKIYHEQNKY